MIDKRNSLNVLHDDNTVFTDYSHKMATYARDNVTITMIVPSIP